MASAHCFLLLLLLLLLLCALYARSSRAFHAIRMATGNILSVIMVAPPADESTTVLPTRLLTLVTESKSRPTIAETIATGTSTIAAASKLGLNSSSWSLRGKEKAAKVTGIPVVTPVTVSPISPSIATSAPYGPSASTTATDTLSSAAGHLAGIVAAATAKPLVGKAATSGNAFLAPKFVGTARRFGLNTMANMARFAANLHQFSTNLRIIGPKDRKRMAAPPEAGLTTEATSLSAGKEAGLGSEDSGIGDVSAAHDDDSTMPPSPATETVNREACNSNAMTTATTASNNLHAEANATKPSHADDDAKLGKESQGRVIIPASSSSSLSLSLDFPSAEDQEKEAAEQDAACDAAMTAPPLPPLPSSSLTASSDESEEDPIMQLANVMETAFSSWSLCSDGPMHTETDAPVAASSTLDPLPVIETDHSIVAATAQAPSVEDASTPSAPSHTPSSSSPSLSSSSSPTAAAASVSTDEQPTESAATITMPAILVVDTVHGMDMNTPPPSPKKQRWFAKVGGKFTQKQDKSTKLLSSVSMSEVSAPQTSKEKTLRKSIRHRLRSVARRDHVGPIDDPVRALDGGHALLSTSIDTVSRVLTASPSSSDDDDDENDSNGAGSDTTQDKKKKSKKDKKNKEAGAIRRGARSLDVPRARRWALDIGAAIRRHHSDSFLTGASSTKKSITAGNSSSSSTTPESKRTTAPPPLLRIDTEAANQSIDDKESDQISSASSASSSSSLPVTPTTPSHGVNDMHCPSRRLAYLGSVRKLQDCRRPLREVIGVQSVLAEVRRVGGVRVPVREVHAALAAGDRDVARRRRRLSAQQLARRQAIAAAEGKPMPLNGMRLDSDGAGAPFSGGHRRTPSSSSSSSSVAWTSSASTSALRRSSSMPLMTPLISFDTAPLTASSPLKLEPPPVIKNTLAKDADDYEEDDVPLALLCDSTSTSDRRSSLATRPMVVAS
ncbi:hypothetical protein SYNPS1DRAFT_28058 [Syncephalis pseudoplumigaleata]|uniref:Uncharacterized protein n=1 Tax=Syncephalis pseudoplumigaleata TaxID=1712513 RepID=A0A4P9Z1M9_9FUNG|nr:hypothetical protein SYNPS1DRAFT_28058 [Syncephalis pseudoplumigaleata]|eukprot:RKP26238.1 hypothetical protein SYNPS1DRAFT_28058 [Syncephalis pseudoplumigaleata]